MNHSELLQYMVKNKHILAKELGYSDIYIRNIEYKLSSGERIDMLFQNVPITCRSLECKAYCLELKVSEIGDHSLLGQLKKAKDAVEKLGHSWGLWKYVGTIAICRKYTASGICLLKEVGCNCFRWNFIGNELILERV